MSEVSLANSTKENECSQPELTKIPSELPDTETELPTSSTECSLSTRGNSQKIIKAIHLPEDNSTHNTETEETFFYVPVTDDEFGN